MDIHTVKKMFEEELLQLPNVTGVGIGKKGNKSCIKVFVTKKVPANELSEKEIVPKTLQGWDTDVEEIGEIHPL
jgi:hypothetical protein